MDSGHTRSWGARPIGDGRWHFAIWAPDVAGVTLELAGQRHEMGAAADGWFGLDTTAAAGAAYGFEIDGTLYPDPAARAQQGDVHGPSLTVDAAAFGWQTDWAGIPWHQAVIYELHVGTFTQDGTLDSARLALPRLKALGITLIELMPLAQFDGHHGWGYDGVLPYAPHPAYGSPDALRRFVDAAHHLGMGVLLDVVYNHLGPSGNYLGAWCPSFFSADRSSPWGQGIAYERAPVRRFFIDNALAWLSEYRLDGLRLDAVHAIDDPSPAHFLDELGATIRAVDWQRPIHLVTEDERNLPGYFEPDAPFDATWNDDWHHAVHCLLTGENESYYAPFAVDPLADIATALRDGFVEQGQVRPENDAPRGAPSRHLAPTCFVNFIGNHDQVGNRARGERLHQITTDRAALRVMTALTLLSPSVPMIFMGDEFLTDAPFLFFADFEGELADAVRTGRAREFARFTAFGGDVPDPIAHETFAASRIGTATRPDQQEHEAFVREVLALRAAHIVPLLKDGANPAATVSREGGRLSARWDFGSAQLDIRCTLGSGEMEPPLAPFFVEQQDGSPFSLAAAIHKGLAL